MKKIRCSWVNEDNQLYVKYHDEEWGRDVHDDRKLFEMLSLEGVQAGLSWEIVLNKRENYRTAFDDFNAEKIVKYDEEKIAELIQDKKIIRNRLKIVSVIKNAKVFIAIQKEFGSFDKYVWDFTDADVLSKDLKKRGMSFVGPTIVYSFMEAIGMIDSHEKDCFMYS